MLEVEKVWSELVMAVWNNIKTGPHALIFFWSKGWPKTYITFGCPYMKMQTLTSRPWKVLKLHFFRRVAPSWLQPPFEQTCKWHSSWGPSSWKNMAFWRESWWPSSNFKNQTPWTNSPMSVNPKIGVTVTPKMDGENHGKPYWNGMIWGETSPYFLDTSIFLAEFVGLGRCLCFKSTLHFVTLNKTSTENHYGKWWKGCVPIFIVPWFFLGLGVAKIELEKTLTNPKTNMEPPPKILVSECFFSKEFIFRFRV